jgi:high frequency lysogenization protein
MIGGRARRRDHEPVFDPYTKARPFVEPTQRNRVIALAALFQAASLVKDVAWQGRCDPDEFRTMVGSLFRFEAADIDGIYGNVHRLRRGMQVLANQLEAGGRGGDMELTRYAVGLLFLERKLMKQPAMAEKVREGIQAAERQRDYFDDMTHPSVVSALAQTYQDTISELGPRIMVQGEQAHLSNDDNAARIRTLLLAGIRAAVLWRQAGGSRWRLLLSRGALLREARAMLAH